MTERASLLLWHIRHEPSMTTPELALVVGAPLAAARRTLAVLARRGLVRAQRAVGASGVVLAWTARGRP